MWNELPKDRPLDFASEAFLWAIQIALALALNQVRADLRCPSAVAIPEPVLRRLRFDRSGQGFDADAHLAFRLTMQYVPKKIHKPEQ
jgi:hypothetical protein